MSNQMDKVLPLRPESFVVLVTSDPDCILLGMLDCMYLPPDRNNATCENLVTVMRLIVLTVTQKTVQMFATFSKNCITLLARFLLHHNCVGTVTQLKDLPFMAY